MAENLLFLTGKLAEDRLTEMVQCLDFPAGSWAIDNLNIKVAALMTEAIVKNRLKSVGKADRIIVPGRSRMDLDSLSRHYGVPVVRGPDEIIDLPRFFGRGGVPPDLSRHDITIFAEIIEAPTLSLEQIEARAGQYKAAGADIIDIGCQPDTPFPHLEDAIKRLKQCGLRVSVDSGDVSELKRGAQAGADFVLSLDEHTLDAVAGTECVPVLVPKPHGDLVSLIRAIDKASGAGPETSRRSDPRSHPFRLHGVAGALRRVAPAAPRCRDSDGDRQPHGADRRR